MRKRVGCSGCSHRVIRNHARIEASLKRPFLNNPLSPPAAPVQGRLQGPPAKSKFLAAAIVEPHPL
jgi:hypothetical protein